MMPRCVCRADFLLLIHTSVHTSVHTSADGTPFILSSKCSAIRYNTVHTGRSRLVRTRRTFSASFIDSAHCIKDVRMVIIDCWLDFASEISAARISSRILCGLAYDRSLLGLQNDNPFS